MSTDTIKFTDEEMDTLVKALRKTWDYIAGDVFQSYADCGERVPSSLSRADVMEISADAHRPMDHGVSKELMTKLYDCDHTEYKRVEKAAFPYKRYS